MGVAEKVNDFASDVHLEDPGAYEELGSDLGDVFEWQGVNKLGGVAVGKEDVGVVACGDEPALAELAAAVDVGGYGDGGGMVGIGQVLECGPDA